MRDPRVAIRRGVPRRGSVRARSVRSQPVEPDRRSLRLSGTSGFRFGMRLGRAGRFGRPARKLFPFFGLLAPNGPLRRTENPRVGGSIPPLATTPNFLKRNGFPASPADYRRPRGRKSADHRTIGNRVDASAGSTRQCGRRVRRRSRCGTVASGVAAWGALGRRPWRPPWPGGRASLAGAGMRLQRKPTPVLAKASTA